MPFSNRTQNQKNLMIYFLPTNFKPNEQPTNIYFPLFSLKCSSTDENFISFCQFPDSPKNIFQFKIGLSESSDFVGIFKSVADLIYFLIKKTVLQIPGHTGSVHRLTGIQRPSPYNAIDVPLERSFHVGDGNPCINTNTIEGIFVFFSQYIQLFIY